MQRSTSFFGEIIKFTIIAIVIVVPIRAYVAQPFIVSGGSMDPTFADKEYLIVDQLTYHYKNPNRGDVVIFRYPVDPSKFFIKRVIGLPGETVEIDEGKVTIFNKENPNGFLLAEDYVSPDNQKKDSTTVVLNSGEYFVLGDNRVGSLDSRAWGPVPEKLITGRPLIRVLPVERVDLLPGEENFEN